MNGYNIFVLIELAKSLGIFSNETEYDVIWEQGSKLYDEFKLSSFDNDSKSEYDCMTDFLILNESKESKSVVTDWDTRFYNWRKKNEFTRKNQYLPIIKIYRRLNMFKNGDVNASQIMLAYPNEVKYIKSLLNPYSIETAKVLNWYNLSNLGKKLMEDLMAELTWNEKEMNIKIYNWV